MATKTKIVLDELDHYVLRASDDPAKVELELMCTRCGSRICDAEPDDTLLCLSQTAADHKCVKPPRK